NSLPYLIVPCLLWAAFWFGPRETSTLAAVSGIIALVHTWRNTVRVQAGQPAATVFAPFLGSSLTANQSLLVLQAFIGLVSLTALLFGAAVAERTRFQEGLAEAEARFRTIFEQAGVGVALVDTATGRFVRVNQRLCSLLGYTAEEVTGKTLQSIS